MSIRYEMLEQGLEAIIQDLKEKAVSKEVIAQIEIFEADVQQVYFIFNFIIFIIILNLNPPTIARIVLNSQIEWAQLRRTFQIPNNCLWHY